MFNNPTPKEEEEIVPEFKYPITEILILPRPEFDEVNNFWNVLKDRKSSRHFKQISLNEISKVLWASAKVNELIVQDNGYILSHRASPSAGARHPIDIIILSPCLNGASSFYYYNPFEHSLNKLNLDDFILHQFKNHLNSIMELQESTIFWFLGHPTRTEAKYQDSISLSWRDAGALIQNIQLTCTALKYNSCAIGTLGEPFISEMFSKELGIFGAGGIAIG